MTGAPTLLAVAHGTLTRAGQAQIRDLVALVARRRPWLDVRLAYVDVQRPRFAEAVAGLARPAVAVPLPLTGLPRSSAVLRPSGGG